VGHEGLAVLGALREDTFPQVAMIDNQGNARLGYRTVLFYGQQSLTIDASIGLLGCRFSSRPAAQGLLVTAAQAALGAYAIAAARVASARTCWGARSISLSEPPALSVPASPQSAPWRRDTIVGIATAASDRADSGPTQGDTR
jgi:hypothetical protein